MKVTREDPKPAFVPIHITLENKEEADYLWHLLNIGAVRVDDKGYRGYRFSDHADTSDNMYDNLDAVYHIDRYGG